MTKTRKALQANLRRKYGYRTCPDNSRCGVILNRGDFNPEADNYIDMEVGWAAREKVNIVCFSKFHGRNERGTASLTFDEVETLYKIIQELKNEWTEFGK